MYCERAGYGATYPYIGSSALSVLEADAPSPGYPTRAPVRTQQR
ncbi:hypothetical protein CGRA01v4_05417 [Colletotrichum graminicola]|nr:hypothetical protein CGRA01v4_05417 [Colletotrichum graminicola]